MKSFRAPWSTSLTVISALVTVVCAGISAGMIWRGDGLVQWGALPPLAIVIGRAGDRGQELPSWRVGIAATPEGVGLGRKRQ